MIILDTNVVSEMMKPAPSIAVSSCLDSLNSAQLYITSVTIAEISYGLSLLPIGKRRTLLANAFNQVITEAFNYRVLLFDEQAAYYYGNLMGKRKELGQPMSVLNGQIASIAKANGAKIATRRVRDFFGCALELINPFEYTYHINEPGIG